MAKSLHIAMFVSIVLFFMSYSMISSQEIDQYSQEVPEDVKISPTSDFDIYVESPDESSFEEADSPAMEYGRKFREVCFQKLNSSYCEDDLFENMVGEGKPALLAECCVELVRDIGKNCYLGMAQMILSSYEYRNIASKAIPISKQTWSGCAHLVENWDSIRQFPRQMRNYTN